MKHLSSVCCVSSTILSQYWERGGKQSKVSAFTDLRVQCKLKTLLTKAEALLFGPLLSNLIFSRSFLISILH